MQCGIRTNAAPLPSCPVVAVTACFASLALSELTATAMNYVAGPGAAVKKAW